MKESPNSAESRSARVQERLDKLQARVESALDIGKDRDAFEFIRLAARLRPQFDLLDQEIKAFHAVAADLILRVNTLMDNIDEARLLAEDGDFSPAATLALDETLTRAAGEMLNPAIVCNLSGTIKPAPGMFAAAATALPDQAARAELARLITFFDEASPRRFSWERNRRNV